jgi:uroporphyrinogen-III decarboxylase
MTNAGLQSGDRLTGLDISRHNAEVDSVWKAFHAGKPTRVPMIVGLATRFYMLSPQANPTGISFRRYTEDPDVMFDTQLAFQRWRRHNVLQDEALGVPETWALTPDFQNYYEAAWFGCPIEYVDGQVPDTRPIYADDPERVMARGVPDPFSSLMARVNEYYEHFKRRAAREQYLGSPIRIDPPCGCGTDGPLTVACSLFGPDFVGIAMIDEPERIQRLLAFITEATIARLKAWRSYVGYPGGSDAFWHQQFWFADDSVALISTDMYRRHVLPHHQRLCEAFAPPGRRFIHLCGDATRHFPTIRDELGVVGFDTGFPVDFAGLRRAIGSQVLIQGGPHIELLRTASPAGVREESARILASGVTEGGRFVLREGNNLAPGTPLENIDAMHDTARALGRFDSPGGRHD